MEGVEVANPVSASTNVVIAYSPTGPASNHPSPADSRNAHSKDCLCVLCQMESKKSASRKNRSCLVVYESHISPEMDGIKLKIKKSPPSEQAFTNQSQGRKRKSADEVEVRSTRGRRPGSLNKKTRKKRRKKRSDSEESDDGEADEMPGEKPTIPAVYRPLPVANGGDAFPEENSDRVREQSVWGSERMPSEVLTKIFMEVTATEGCVPTLIRLSQVCRLWWTVAASPELWHTVDLSSPCIKEKYRTEPYLLWLLNNRLTRVKDLSLGGWNSALGKAAMGQLTTTCTELTGISLAGCKGLTGENLQLLIQNCSKLERLDLSGVSPYSANPRGAISITALCEMAKVVGTRLTHLNLANNCTTGLNQIIAALAVHCSNLTVLDLSNLRTANGDTVSINVEQLQNGCPRLQVLRFTNSPIRLSATSLKDQAASPGFPFLEELSIAVDAKNMTSMDNASMERILKGAHKLRLLDVRGCTSISNSSLVRIPAWDLEHLFLSGCSATRLAADGLELVIRKWRHSLVEVDLSWTSAAQALDQAVYALAEDNTSPLKIMNLCGSSVSFGPVRQLLMNCTRLRTLNLSSCRALPRGIKRLYDGVTHLAKLRSTIQEGRFNDDHNEDQG